LVAIVGASRFGRVALDNGVPGRGAHVEAAVAAFKGVIARRSGWRPACPDTSTCGMAAGQRGACRQLNPALRPAARSLLDDSRLLEPDS
jgi:hypothetical protein